MTTAHIITQKWDTYRETLPFGEKNSVERKAYRAQSKAIYDLFKRDLYAEAAMTNHPRRDNVFNLAWSLGHSSGYHEVASYYHQIVDSVFGEIE